MEETTFHVLFADDGTYSIVEVDKKTYFFKIIAKKLNFKSVTKHLAKINNSKDKEKLFY